MLGPGDFDIRRRFKPPRKNSKAAKQTAGLCSHPTGKVEAACSIIVTTCVKTVVLRQREIPRFHHAAVMQNDRIEDHLKQSKKAAAWRLRIMRPLLFGGLFYQGFSDGCFGAQSTASSSFRVTSRVSPSRRRVKISSSPT